MEETLQTAKKTAKGGTFIIERQEGDRVVALAGNPNVGKSTVFNELTGMRQHTGNWPGKTVSNAQGRCTHNGRGYVMVDIPGTYSLLTHSAEEEAARDFLCFGAPDATIVVCDATCLERNMNLVLQTLEITGNVVVCVNLMDEAEKKGIKIDTGLLARQLGVPVVGTSARSRKGLRALMNAVERVTEGSEARPASELRYPHAVEAALAPVIGAVSPLLPPDGKLCARWVALKLLCEDAPLLEAMRENMGLDVSADPEVTHALRQSWAELQRLNIDTDMLRDMVVSSIVLHAEESCSGAVTFEKAGYNDRDRRLDRLLTSRATGIPVMLLLLSAVFWLTITGANYPSQLISELLFRVQDQLSTLFIAAGAPEWLRGALVDGVWRVLAWVVAVMLPPMAIFFPLFTLLEDSGYLPRVAFNLDKSFKRCSACGKQSLTMCMGLGCNAVGVTGCRIIDSPRERLIAMLTNCFVPCNGRFPTLIAIITMFFIGGMTGVAASAASTLLLTGVIVLGVVMTFAVSSLLSKTLLKGVPSSFTLELPPYRRPQIGRVIVRSVLDRTLFVLGRAVAVAAPAGLLIWIMANVTVGDASLLAHCSGWLDPFARVLGLDGVILMAFILGFPANEIVLPIVIMAYLSTGSIADMSDLSQLRVLLVDNGWTWLTAVNMMLFSLMHWPCSTTCLTVHKETRSVKWTLISFALPTAIGILVCAAFAGVVRMFGLV